MRNPRPPRPRSGTELPSYTVGRETGSLTHCMLRGSALLQSIHSHVTKPMCSTCTEKRGANIDAPACPSCRLLGR